MPPKAQAVAAEAVAVAVVAVARKMAPARTAA
jgi:hypothetical protein